MNVKIGTKKSFFILYAYIHTYYFVLYRLCVCARTQYCCTEFCL